MKRRLALLALLLAIVLAIPPQVAAFRPWMVPRVNRYLLQDNFNDNRAAGAVNGTRSDSGALRTVVDTGGKLTVSGGNLVFATGGYGDAGLWGPAAARVAGRVLVDQMAFADLVGHRMFGWDNDQTGTVGIYGLNSNGANFATYDGATGPYVVTVAAATPYVFAFPLRATGAFYMVKGGAFPTWTLLQISAVGTTSPIYPSQNGGDSSRTVDYIRIPLTLWLPAPLSSDGFADANGTALSAHPTDGAGHAETSGIGSGGTGQTWQHDVGCWAIQTNKAVGTPTLGAELAAGTLTVGSWYTVTASEVNHFYAGSLVNDTFVATAATALDALNKVQTITLSSMLSSISHSTPDVLASIDGTIAARSQGGIVVNLDSAVTPANFVIAYADRINAKAYLDEYVAGVRTNKINGAIVYSAAATVQVVRDGTYASFLYNNLLVGTSSTMTANTNTAHGVFNAAQAWNSLDNWVCYPRKGYTVPE